MARTYQNNNITNAAADLVAALAGRRLNVKGLELSNADSVDHTFILKDGATEWLRVRVAANASRAIAFAGEHGEKGKLLTAGNALRVETAVAATASTVFAWAEAGRV